VSNIGCGGKKAIEMRCSFFRKFTVSLYAKAEKYATINSLSYANLVGGF
jgi:hypothetical protein